LLNAPLVSIVVLNWNGEDIIKECIYSLLDQTYSNYEIIIVDNASTDNSVDIIKNEFPEIRLIINQKNLGFASGNNIGIRTAKGKYIALFNNDAVADRNWLLKLVSAILEEKRIGIVSGPIFFSEQPEVIWSIGSRFDLITGLDWDLGKYQKKHFTPENIDYFSMCAILIKKEVFQKIGLLDERFFIYYEDFDFCLRAKENNYKLKLVPVAVVWHKVSMGARKNLKISQFNMLKSFFQLILKIWPLWCLPITIVLRLFFIPFIEVLLFGYSWNYFSLTWQSFQIALINNRNLIFTSKKINKDIISHIRIHELIKRSVELYKILKYIYRFKNINYSFIKLS
jgi:hypothetical protein